MGKRKKSRILYVDSKKKNMKQTGCEMALKHARHDAQDDLKAELGRQLNFGGFFLKIVGQTTRASHAARRTSALPAKNQTLLSIWQKSRWCTSRGSQLPFITDLMRPFINIRAAV